MRLNGFTSRINNGNEAKKTGPARRWVLGVVLATVAVLATAAVAPLMADDDKSSGDWPMFGQDLTNTAYRLAN